MIDSEFERKGREMATTWDNLLETNDALMRRITALEAEIDSLEQLNSCGHKKKFTETYYTTVGSFGLEPDGEYCVVCEHEKTVLQYVAETDAILSRIQDELQFQTQMAKARDEAAEYYRRLLQEARAGRDVVIGHARTLAKYAHVPDVITGEEFPDLEHAAVLIEMYS